MHHSRLVIAGALLILAACGGKDSPTDTTTPVASMSLLTGSATVSVEQGASASAVLTIGRTNFSSDVLLTAEGLPTGVTATFTPPSVAAGSTTSTLALAASGAAAVGSTTVTVRARATGVADVTTSIALTVTATATGTVSLQLTPAASTIAAGQTAVSTLAITRGGGFSGGVNLTVSGAPAGLTTSLSTANPVLGNSVTLSLQSASTVVPGPYTLTVRANTPGLTEATATYVLTVNAPVSTAVSWRYCATERIPIWFAYLDGNGGTWQRVQPAATGQFDFAVGQPTVGIASVYVDRGVTVTEVRYYDSSELTTAAAAECVDNPEAGTKSLTGTITGFTDATESATISIGTAVSTSATDAARSFSMARVPSGVRDLIGVRGISSSNTTLRMLVIRGTNVANGATIGPLDLGAGASFIPATSSLIVTAPNDGPMSGSTSYATANGSVATLSIGAISSNVAVPYTGVPTARLDALDVQRITVEQTAGSTLSRSIVRYIRGPAPVSVRMPADPATPTVTAIAGASYPRATVTGTIPAAFNRQVIVEWESVAGARRWLLGSTSAARSASLDFTLQMPDFSAVSGWTPAWQLTAGATEVTSRFFGQENASPTGTPISGTTTFTTSRKTAFTF
jgi:hypothetical protein